MEEMLDVLDENGNKTGIVKPKSQVKKDGDFFRGIKVYVINSKKEVITHQRSSNKVIYPNLWSAFVVGHVMAGESSVNACVRELGEELGIFINKEELKYLYTFKDCNSSGIENHINNIFNDIYLLVKDIELESLKLQVDEVADVRYLNCYEVGKMLDNSKEFVNNSEEFERVLIEIDSRK